MSLLSTEADGVHDCQPQCDTDIWKLWDGAVWAEHNFQWRVCKLHLCKGNCCIQRGVFRVGEVEFRLPLNQFVLCERHFIYLYASFDLYIRHYYSCPSQEARVTEPWSNSGWKRLLEATWSSPLLKAGLISALNHVSCSWTFNLERFIYAMKGKYSDLPSSDRKCRLNWSGTEGTGLGCSPCIWLRNVCWELWLKLSNCSYKMVSQGPLEHRWG